MRPPMSSDSEDDYDGFSFGSEFDNRPKRTTTSSQWLLNQRKDENDLSLLLHCVKNGDLNGVKEQLLKRYSTESNIKWDDYVKDGWPLLMFAICDLQFEVVSYLIDKGANVDCQADSLTPLMLVCKIQNTSDADVTLQIAKLLIEKGATVNIRDKTGYTPFIYACTYGNEGIVDFLLKSVAIDAIDNRGYTALHYAVNGKHFEIVKALIDAGADIEIADNFGVTPRMLAEEADNAEIKKLFPEEIVDNLPMGSDQFQSYHDLAPTIFPDHDQPAYAQNIPMMLRGMRAEICGKQLYEARISLPEFLTIDNDRLKSIGIDFEYQRKRILHGLLKFHRHPYSPESIAFISQYKHKNMYQYYEVYAGYLKHLIMMKSAMDYIFKISGTKMLHQRTLREMIVSLEDIQKDLVLLQKSFQQLSKFSSKNPLFIGSVETENQRYRIFRPFVKYAIIIGMGIFLSCKVSKLR